MKISHLFFGILLAAIGFLFGSFKNSQSTASIPAEEEPQERTRRDVDPVTKIWDTEKATIALFEDVSPSVVFISTSLVRRNRWSMNEMEVPSGTGSGFIWDDQGHIVTNFHVIEDALRNGGKFEVNLSDQSTWEAEYVGAEPNKDIAVLKISAPVAKLKAIQLGSYGELKVGQSVFAIGNPFGLDHSLTTGVISALGREITSVSGRPIKDVIQTDAAINPGNSGGPLIDTSHRLIGVNTMIYSPSGASAGIGFSIPVDVVNWVVPDLIEFGKLNRPILGVELLPQQHADRMEIKGAMLYNVADGSAAAQAGLKAISRNNRGEIEFGDIITNIDGKSILTNNDLILFLETYKPGDIIQVTYQRNDQENQVELKLSSSIN